MIEQFFPTIAMQDLCVSHLNVHSGVRCAGTTVSRKVGRPSHGLLLVEKGRARFSRTEKKDLTGMAGDVLLIPRESIYTLRYTEKENSFILLNFQLFTPSGETVTLSDDVFLFSHASEDLKIKELFKKVQLCAAGENASGMFKKKAYFFSLLSELFSCDRLLTQAPLKPKFANITPGVKMLHEHYTEDIPISQLAQACNISTSSFRELFSEQYGLPPVKYRTRLRINHARALITQGNCTVAEAAYASGFANLGYFCRCYKKETGELPSQTRSIDF